MRAMLSRRIELSLIACQLKPISTPRRYQPRERRDLLVWTTWQTGDENRKEVQVVSGGTKLRRRGDGNI